MVLEIPLQYIASVVSRISNYALASLGANIQYGYAGLFTLCMAAFGALGAYTTAILVTQYHADFFSVLIASIIVVGVAAFLIGTPILRTRGDYFGIVTLGFAYIIFSLLLNWNGEPIYGSLGIPSISKPSAFGWQITTAESFAALSLLVLGIAFCISYLIGNSAYGRVLRAIREDEDAACSIGKNTTKYKMSAFIAGAIMAGLSGSLYAYWSSYIEPRSFSPIESVFVLFMVIIGGKGNPLGSIIGAALFVLLPEPLRFLNIPVELIGGIRQLILGILLLTVVLFHPQGILPEKINKYTEKKI